MRARLACCILLAGSLALAQNEDPVRVALFADPGSTDAKSREAVYNLLKDRQDISVEKVTTETVRTSGWIKDYDVFILPGGTGGGEAKAVGIDAAKELSAELRAGKGLIAICAGGYYVAEGWNPTTSALDVISARNHDGEHWARGEGFIAVQVLDDSGGQTSQTMWFENGPIFIPSTIDGIGPYTSLVKYETDLHAKDAPSGQMNGRDAIIAADYGKGRVVAFGPHPELSPQVNHWLINSIKWAAKRHAPDAQPSTKSVLEGK